MATTSPAPTPGDDAVRAKPWVAPTSDQEFEFESMDSAPDWIDRNWAGFDQGPALMLPAGNLVDFSGPYTTKSARVGDKVLFVAARGSTPPHFEVVRLEPDPSKPGQSQKKPPQQSAAPLEDMLRNGLMTVDELSEDAKAQLLVRTPGMKTLIEDGTGAPDQQSIADIVKLD